MDVQCPEEPDLLWDFPGEIENLEIHLDPSALNEHNYCSMVRNMGQMLAKLKKVKLNMSRASVNKEHVYLIIVELS